MTILYLLLPVSLLLAVIAFAAFWWAGKSGQFDDLDSPAHRILTDEAAVPRASDKAKGDAGKSI